MENDTNLKHKLLFFFMPEKITSVKILKDDDENAAILKSISPYFYWCSAHEFKSIKSDKNFLFQYQTYGIENKKIVPYEVIQEWLENKNGVKVSIMNFIEKWADHKRVIFDAKKMVDSSVNFEDTENFFSEKMPDCTVEDFEYFTSFATFVAKSILNLQHLYIKQSEDRNFEFIQKKFWENTAMHYQNIIFELSKRDSKKESKPKNKKNETVRNKKSK